MSAGFYTIASGMMVRQKELDTIGNNLSNIQTPGYRADRVVTSDFEMSLLKRMEADGEEVLGNGRGSAAAVVANETVTTEQGAVEPSGRVMDFALNGDGYFNVQGQDGTVYLTRNGQFEVDDQGYLTLPGMGQVMGTNGPIRPGSEEITVDEAGNVYNAQGQLAGTLKITVPAQNTQLVRRENGAFTAQGAVNAQGYQVVQGSLETSNVDMNQEMSNFISVQRAFQTCSSALQIMDGIDRKAAAQIASIQ